MKRFSFISSRFFYSELHHTNYVSVYHQTITRKHNGHNRTYMYDYVYYHNDSDLNNMINSPIFDSLIKRQKEIRSLIIKCHQKKFKL